MEKCKDLILFPKALAGAVFVGAILAGGLYFFYKQGRVDEINELCRLVEENGELPMKFVSHGKTIGVFLSQLS